MSTPIAQLHEEWVAKCLPADAPQVQRQEMERAFYSGFFAALSWQLEVADKLSEDHAMNRLQDAFDECEAYFKTLGQAPRDITRS